MRDLLYVEINLIGIAVLIVIWFKGRFYRVKDDKHKAFRNLMIAILIWLLLDSMMWLIDGKLFLGAINLNIIITTIFYCISILVGSLWLIYCDYILYEEDKNRKKRFSIYLIPSILNLMLSLVSIKTGGLFHIDSNNIYNRGNLYWIHIILNISCFLYCLFMSIKVLSNKKYLKRKEVYSVMNYMIIPFVALIIQAFFYGVSIIPVSFAITMLIIFLNNQSNLIIIDPLTGIYNRRAFEEYIEREIKYLNREHKVFLLIIDVDNFKGINDIYGHSVGDEALINIAKILRISSNNGDLLVRLGGDEFAIIGNRFCEKEIIELIKNINKNIENENKKNEYKLSVSIGYSIFQENNIDNIRNLINESDEKMYEAKELKKRGK